MVRRFLAVAMALAVAIFLFSADSRTAVAKDPDLLSFGAGAFDVFGDESAAQFNLEYRSGYKLWVIKPFVGVMGTTDSAFFGYGGLLFDFKIGNFAIVPNFAFGYYDKGDGKDLGNEFEIRSRLELAYIFENEMRLGVAISHISNASTGSDNPGTEIVEAIFSIPLNF